MDTTSRKWLFRSGPNDHRQNPGVQGPPSASVLAVGEMENRFRDASDRAERFLAEGLAAARGSAQAATAHLLARSLADLRCGQYLIGNGFVLQMASVVRPALESLNLVKLFAQDTEAADRWASGQHSREFMPARVRDAIGVGQDEVYSWLSEASHPRFAGFQMTAYQVIHEDHEEGPDRDPQAPRLHLFIGGLPLELPIVLNAATMPSNVLCQLALELDNCPVRREVAWTWATAAREIVETVRPGYEAIGSVLVDQSPESAEMNARLLAEIDTAIEAAREMEQIMQEERDRVGE